MKQIFTTLLLLTISTTSFAERTFLVALSAMDGGEYAAEYYGVVDQKTYESITSSLTKNKMVKLENVFWVNNEGKKERMSTTSRNGHRFGYTNTIFLKENSITRIVVLDEEYLESLEEK